MNKQAQPLSYYVHCRQSYNLEFEINMIKNFKYAAQG